MGQAGKMTSGKGTRREDDEGRGVRREDEEEKVY